MNIRRNSLVVHRNEPNTQLIVGNMRDGTNILVGRYDWFFGFLRGTGKVVNIKEIQLKDLVNKEED